MMIKRITIIVVSEKGRDLAEKISFHYDDVTISRLPDLKRPFMIRMR